MTLYSPVVITENEEAAKEALNRGWHVVRRYPGSDKVITITGNDVLCGIPSPTFSIIEGSLDVNTAPIWKYVLNWIAGHVLRPLLVVEPGDYLTELALWAASSRGWPIGALIREEPAPTASTLALLTASSGFFIPDEALSDSLTSLAGVPVTHLEDTPLISITARQPLAPRTKLPGVTNVLMVTYGAGSEPAVRRAQEWYEELQGDEHADIAVDVCSTTDWLASSGRTHRVGDFWSANWAASDHALSEAVSRFLRPELPGAFEVTQLVGGLWPKALERYFNGRGHDHYDVVLFTGEPAYYDLAAFAKSRWYATVILDYPEPRPALPHSEWSAEAGQQFDSFARGLNFSGDIITAPDSSTAQLVAPCSPEFSVEVVSSGRGAAPGRSMAEVIRDAGDHAYVHPAMP